MSLRDCIIACGVGLFTGLLVALATSHKIEAETCITVCNARVKHYSSISCACR
jgi:hypothetical protein